MMQYQAAVVKTPEEIESIFDLRIRVFVEEQKVPEEEELDAYDKVATHFLIRSLAPLADEPSCIVGTARLVDKGSSVGKVGRVAILPAYRGLGLGKQLMLCVEEFAQTHGFHKLVLDAQCYAIPFYEKVGYIVEGDVFLDAGIEHRRMWKRFTNIHA